MDLGLHGKTALVLGGSGGLGKAIATLLAAEGAKVAVAGRNVDKVAQVVDQISAAGGEAIPAVWSLDDIGAADSAVATIEERFGGVDILVNNTGGPPPSPAAGQDPDLWRKQFEAMTLSVVALTDRILPGMRSRRWGRIITSTSSGVVAPIANLGLSNALRSALMGWSKTLAGEVAKDGVTVNVVVPGRLATNRVASLDEQKAKRLGVPVDEVVSQSLAGIPVGRYGDPDEYAAAVAFLASRQASYITGTVLRVDGGMIASI